MSYLKGWVQIDKATMYCYREDKLTIATSTEKYYVFEYKTQQATLWPGL